MAPAAGGMKRPAHGGEPNAPKAPRMNSGAEAAEQVQLPRGTIGKVIGKGGSGLRQIREASGCQLTVDSQTSMAQISGPPEAIATAKALVHMRGAEPYPNPVDGQSTLRVLRAAGPGRPHHRPRRGCAQAVPRPVPGQ